MKQKNGELKKASELRKRAVEKFKSKPALPGKLSKLDVQALIEELRIHQIQLEMQNDEIRKAQQVVEESRAKYSNLYDFAPVGYLTLNQEGLILGANLTASSQLGVERRRLINKPLFLFMTKKEGKDLFYLYLRKIFRTKSLETYEGELKGKDSTPFYAQLESIVVKDDSSQCRTAITDITERKQALTKLQQGEEQLRAANRRLGELLATKDQFIATVSHELRTPLTAIIEGVSLLGDGVLGALSAEQSDFVHTVAQSADRLALLIEHLLDLSKIEAGRLPLSRRRLTLPPLIEATLKPLQSLAGRRTIRCEWGATPDVFADGERIAQVVTNLFANAVKFTEDEGTITCRCQVLDGQVAVTIQDDGAGIAAGDLPKLFERFSQVGEYKPGGTGLGLALCKELVALHRGTISAASEPGKGSAFTFTVPVYTPALALEESFRQLLETTKASLSSPMIGLIAIDCQAAAEPLERIAQRVRRYLKNGDLVLDLEPPWVVCLAHTDVQGVQAICRRLQGSLEGPVPVTMGWALYPVDGADAHTLLAEAISLSRARNVIPPGPRKQRILVADDDPTILQVMTLRLEALGFEVQVASHGEEVLEQVKGQLPADLILLDLKLPRLDGFEVCRQVAALGKKIPIVAFTAYGKELKDKLAELGLTDVLKKPFSTKELIEKVTQALARGGAHHG